MWEDFRTYVDVSSYVSRNWKEVLFVRIQLAWRRVVFLSISTIYFMLTRSKLYECRSLSRRGTNAGRTSVNIVKTDITKA